MEEKLIYVVDDEKDIREMVKTFLENEGYRIKIFSTADEALESMGMAAPDNNGKQLHRSPLNAEKPDLVIMDIMMPGTSGLTACNRIRKSSDGILSGMPIILVSAKDTPLDRVTGLTMGSDDYLIKPFLPLELVARVKALLRRSEILKEKLLRNTGILITDPEDKVLLGADLIENFNGVKNSTFGGENTEKCGNLILNYAARKIYVEEHMKTEEIQEYQETELKMKNSDGVNGGKLTEVQVTPMEFDFVYYLMLRKETAVSKAELLAGVWHLPDAELQEDVRMTDDLVKRLRKKLRAAGSSARVETVWGFGYRLTEN